MAKYRTCSIEVERQVAQEYLGGEALHGLSKRHDLSRNLIRVWVEKHQAGGLDQDVVAADLLQTYEDRIAALERLVGLRRSPRCWGCSVPISRLCCLGSHTIRERH